MTPLCKLPKSLRLGRCPGMGTGVWVGDDTGRAAEKGLPLGGRGQWSMMDVLEIGICPSWHVMLILVSSTRCLRDLFGLKTAAHGCDPVGGQLLRSTFPPHAATSRETELRVWTAAHRREGCGMQQPDQRGRNTLRDGHGSCLESPLCEIHQDPKPFSLFLSASSCCGHGGVDALAAWVAVGGAGRVPSIPPSSKK